MKFRQAFLVVALLAAGCGGRAVVKPQGEVPQATPAPSAGPKLPSLVDVHEAVSDQDYQAAMAAIGTSGADRHNLDSYFTAAQYQYNHANYAEALKTYQKMLLAPNASSQLDKVQYMVGQVYYDKKDFLPALAAFETVLHKFPKSPYVAQSLQMMEFILTYSLGFEDLRRYVANYPDSPMNCFALFQLGSREAQTGMQTEALGHLSAFIQQCPQNPSVGAAQLLLQSLQSQEQGKSWKIGVLAPITGRFKDFGESVINGITLAMEQANQAGGSRKPMSVVARDTGGDPIQAVKAFQDLTKDNSLDAVIGPVLSPEIAAVAPLANQQRITLISPSVSRDGLSTLGPYLFSNSMTNEMQGRAIAKFAVEHMGLKRFAILAPDDGYGETLSEAFQGKVESMGATVTGSGTYPASSTDFKAQLVALGGQDPGIGKENERENNRRFDELKYSLGKEIGKIILKAKEVSETSTNPAPVSAVTPAIAFFPMVEGLTNTACPSIVRDVNDAVRGSLRAQTDFILRSDDLIQQDYSRLPVEFKGTTQTVTAEQWGDIAQDLQVSLIITGRVIETNPPNDWGDHPTWDYTLNFEAFQANPQKNAFVRIYQSKILYSAFKPPGLVRTASNYQALYLPAHSVEIPLLVSQIHFYDLNPVFLGGHLWDNDTVLQEGGKDLEGSYFVTGFYVDSPQDNVKKFAGDYLRRFAKRPDLLAAQSFDAARLLLRATDTSLNRDDIHNNLMAIKDFDGVSGKTTFGGHGEADKLVPVIKIQDGKYQQVQ